MVDVILVTHKSMMTIHTTSDDTTLVRCHTRLATSMCTCCACFAKNMMMMNQEFPRIWYVSQVSFWYRVGKKLARKNGGNSILDEVTHMAKCECDP